VPGVVEDLAAEQAELANLLCDRPRSDWSRGTRCEGWAVLDVVLHLAQTNEFAVASVTGERLSDATSTFSGSPPGAVTVDERVAALVAAERDAPPDQVHQRWVASARALDGVLADADLHRRVPWVVGLLSVQTLAATRLAETWIHAGDVADALGVESPPTDRLFYVARLAWRTLPYAFERAGRRLSGPVAMHLRSPAGEPWLLQPDAEALTTIRGEALDLCLVAARRLDPAASQLDGDGPDVAAVLDLVRTYA